MASMSPAPIPSLPPSVLAQWGQLSPATQATVLQEIQRQRRIRAGAQDPLTFGRLYLPEHFRAETPAFHREIMATALAAERTGRGVVLGAPRNHGKSTLFSLLYPLWSAVYRRKRFLVILSSSGTQAELFADAIKKEIEQNEQLLADFGPLCGEDYGMQWRNTDMMIAHPQRDAQGQVIRDRLGHPLAETTVRLVARGAQASVRGLRSRAYRPDLVIADDLETDELVATPEQRLKMRNWWYRAVEPLGDPGIGQTVVIGTILHHDSLLANLLSRPDVYTTHVYRAVQPDGTALWPARWSRATLEEQRRKIGSLAFAQEYLNEPLDPASQVFKPAWWQWYAYDAHDADASDVTFNAATDQWEYHGQPLAVYAAVDPAMGGADEFALIVIGVTADQTVVVLYAWQGHLDFPAQVAKVTEVARDWLPRTLAIEANAYQAALGQHVRRQVLVPVHQVTHTSGGGGGPGRAKPRIVALAPYVEHGQVLLRRALPHQAGTDVPEIGIKVHAQHWPLFEQATQYPASAHDDRLDALQMAISVARVRRFFEGLETLPPS